MDEKTILEDELESKEGRHSRASVQNGSTYDYQMLEVYVKQLGNIQLSAKGEMEPSMEAGPFLNSEHGKVVAIAGMSGQRCSLLGAVKDRYTTFKIAAMCDIQ